jgi:hypothetical protein
MADGQTLYGDVTLDALRNKAALATDANGVIIEGSSVSGDLMIDGGFANSTYLTPQNIDGGGA